MNNYRLFFDNPQNNLIRIEMDLPASNEAMEVFLSKWRPGRYELAPYAENVVDVQVRTASGAAVAFEKTAYNAWRIGPSPEEKVVLSYKYYAVAGDAGGSLFNESQVYINGVNLFMYRKEDIATACKVELNLPDAYKIACGLRQEGMTLFADDYHQLVDAPLIASPGLQHKAFEVAGIMHNVWFQGNVKPDWNRIEKDFRGYGQAQMDLFGDFPVKEYHYLFQIHDRHFYHGVEHFNSTVIALGPGYKLMQAELYEELLGVSCHELFHTWNVKAIRPADMRPYDYDRENYCRLHYITEGVTTYYGDLMLLKGGVWNLEEFLRVFNKSILGRHYGNNGRDHISLEHSSFDSWLIGYKTGVPNRKISFYTKGCLAAFILDYRIRKASGNVRSLDSVMREMYERFGKTEAGYTRADYKSIAESHAGHSLDDYFEEYISGTLPMETALAEAAAYYGLKFAPAPPPSLAEGLYGFKAEGYAVKQVFENSPASKAGLRPGDHLLAANGIKLTSSNLGLLIEHFMDESELRLHIFRDDNLKKCTLDRKGYQHQNNWLFIDPEASEEQVRNREAWMRVNKTTPA